MLFRSAEQRGEHGGHAARRHVTGFRPLDQGEPLLQHGQRRVAVAGIDVARIVAGEAGFRGSGRVVDRSEQHTSELQSLMRNSYAVFCLKKKNEAETYITKYRQE